MQARRNIRPIALLLRVLLVGCLSNVAHGHDANWHDFQIVAVDDSDTTHRIVANLRKKIPSAQLLSDRIKHRQNSKNTVYITIGPTALRSLLSQGLSGVIISAFTSSEAYHAILESAPAPHSTNITAIYAEPSPSVQLRLISMLYKKPTGVAVILSNKTSFLDSIIRNAATQTKTDLTVEKIADGESLNRVINRLAEAPVLLAVPDITIYNAENIRNILVTTYRRNQSVIGFSASLVKAGALASSYSDIEDIDAQIDEVIDEFETSGKLLEPQFPKYFSVLVNEDVARSLNIVVDESVKKFTRKPVVRQP